MWGEKDHKFFMTNSYKNPFFLRDPLWHKQLCEEECTALEVHGIEGPFNGEFWNHNAKGVYCCSECKEMLFSSADKYDSGTGWPSFSNPISSKVLTYHIDYHLSYPRKEVRCNNCQAHLGHVYEDGPEPTKKRFCIFSLSLRFQEID